MKKTNKKKQYYLFMLMFTFLISAHCQSYDRGAAAEYAELWWNSNENDYNSDYYYYYGDNNCCNFVSQCIIAGGYNLSEGTDGNGADLDDFGAIPFCDNLHLHLHNYKVNDPDNDYVRLNDPNEPVWMEKGDVAIFGDSNSDPWQHGVFAVTGENGSGLTYNANTNNRNHKPVTWFYTADWPSSDFYHIKDYLETPMFCFNCLWDEEEGETSADCGGPCPPCDDAPDYKNYTMPTNNLPEVTLAMQEISVDVSGNNYITVEPNQSVVFKAGESIKLKPGFHAKSNSGFKASISINNNELTRICEQTCIPEQYYGFMRPCGYELDLVNIEYYDIDIYQFQSGSSPFLIYEGEGAISSNGLFCFWDGCEGVNFDVQTINFGVYLTLVSCYNGEIFSFNPAIGVLGSCDKSENGNNKSLNKFDNELKFSFPKSQAIYPNPNKGIFHLSNNIFKSPYSVIVFDVFGNKVFENIHTNLKNTTINITNKPRGLYIVKIYNKNSIITEKIIYR